MKYLGVYGWDIIKMAVRECVYWNFDVLGFVHYSAVHTCRVVGRVVARR
jgi:hypothetical protein